MASTTSKITAIATVSDPAGAQPNASDPSGTPATHYFFFNDTATTEIYTLSLHDALPIYNFQVDAPAHTYGEEGVYTIKVTVTHETATPLTVTTGEVITVNEENGTAHA